jgi:hypothetical protein
MALFPRVARVLSVALALASLIAPATGHAQAEDAEETGESDGKPDGDTGSAAKAPPKDDEAETGGADRDMGHMGQFGLRAGLVGGYRMVLRYDTSPFCAPPDPTKEDKDQRKFCGHGAPFAVDLGLSFALLDFFEPFVWARLGLGPERQTDTKAVLILGIGARLYMTSDSMVKVFIEPAVAYEFEGGRGTREWQRSDIEYSQDLVFHLAAGPQIDFHRNVGVYLTAGVTTGVIRALHNSLDLAGGLQGRFP